jgi:large subunit ribosomal protein L21
MMYAVFEDGSRQYKVSQGDLVTVDLRDGEIGSAVELNHVLLYRNGDDIQIGRPLVEGARVLGEITDHPSTKYTIQHYRRRKNYRRFKGHRQHYTQVRVQHILLAGQEPPHASAAAGQSPPAEQQAPPPQGS